VAQKKKNKNVAAKSHGARYRAASDLFRRVASATSTTSADKSSRGRALRDITRDVHRERARGRKREGRRSGEAERNRRSLARARRKAAAPKTHGAVPTSRSRPLRSFPRLEVSFSFLLCNLWIFYSLVFFSLCRILSLFRHVVIIIFRCMTGCLFC